MKISFSEQIVHESINSVPNDSNASVLGEFHASMRAL